MLNVKILSYIFPGREKSTLYAIIRKLKYKYNLNYDAAEIPINIIVDEYGITLDVIIALIIALRREEINESVISQNKS